MTPVKWFFDSDPYECCFKLVPHKPKTILENKHLFEHYYKEAKKAHPDTEDKFKAELKTKETQKIFEEVGKNDIKGFFQNHGMFCLTDCPSNIHMWAQYGRNHTGYCLVFEMDFDYISGLINVVSSQYKDDFIASKEIISFSHDGIEFVFGKVTYSDLIPSIYQEQLELMKSEYERKEYIFNNCLGVKLKKWKYENEYRLVANVSSEPNENGQESHLMNLPNYAPFLKVTGVIMGANLNQELKGIFHTLCKKHEINLFQAECSDKEYKININLKTAVDASVSFPRRRESMVV